MTLTVICDVLGKENNGTTIAAMNLIRSMRAKGHTVRVVCADEERRGEKDYYVVPTQDLGPLNLYLKKNGVTLALPDNEIILKALDGADAVHIMTPFLLASRAAKLAHELGLPITAGFHCQAENFTSHIFLQKFTAVNKLVYKAFDRSVYRYVDCIHFPTQFICNDFEKEIGHPTVHRVISNGVNRAFVPHRCEKPEELKGKFVILFTGRYSREKSHHILIKAAGLSRHRGEIQLIFAGSGPLEEKLRKQARSLPNEPIFRFFSREEMVRVYNYSDLYVHPAEVELEAIACLEAISCGLVPVINDSPRSATKYFAKSRRNLFDFSSAEDLAAKIDWWIEHPAQRAACAKSYADYARMFNFDHCMDEMENMIVSTAFGTRCFEGAAEEVLSEAR